MLLLIRWLKGYLRVRFYGDFFEKILDICASGGITLWGSRLIKNGIESNISIRDFKKLREIKRRRGIRIHILSKKGLPFHIRKHRHRAGLLIGLVFFLAFIKLMSGYIWVIEVEGNEYIPSEKIISQCEELGIVCGIKKNKIDPKRHRQLLLMKSEELAWVSFNVEGSKLTVDVSETKKVDKRTGASNLKALYDGIIKKVDITGGSSVVSVGDIVKKGDLLVSGVVEESGETKFIKATGTVIAETKQEIALKEDFKQTHSYKTGETAKRRVLEIFNIKLPLYLGSIKGEYVSEYAIKELRLFGAKLPISIHKRNFERIETQNIIYNEEQLKERLKARLQAEIADNATIIDEQYNVTELGIELKATIKSEMDICISEPILMAEE